MKRRPKERERESERELERDPILVFDSDTLLNISVQTENIPLKS